MKTLSHITALLLITATAVLVAPSVQAEEVGASDLGTFHVQLVEDYAQRATTEAAPQWAMALGGMGLRLGGVSYLWNGGSLEQAGEGQFAGLNQGGMVFMPAALNLITHPIMPSTARIEANTQDQRLRDELQGSLNGQSLASTLRDAPGFGLTVGIAF